MFGWFIFSALKMRDEEKYTFYAFILLLPLAEFWFLHALTASGVANKRPKTAASGGDDRLYVRADSIRGDARLGVVCKKYPSQAARRGGQDVRASRVLAGLALPDCCVFTRQSATSASGRRSSSRRWKTASTRSQRQGMTCPRAAYELECGHCGYQFTLDRNLLTHSVKCNIVPSAAGHSRSRWPFRKLQTPRLRLRGIPRRRQVYPHHRPRSRRDAIPWNSTRNCGQRAWPSRGGRCAKDSTPRAPRRTSRSRQYGPHLLRHVCALAVSPFVTCGLISAAEIIRPFWLDHSSRPSSPGGNTRRRAVRMHGRAAKSRCGSLRLSLWVLGLALLLLLAYDAPRGGRPAFLVCTIAVHRFLWAVARVPSPLGDAACGSQIDCRIAAVPRVFPHWSIRLLHVVWIYGGRAAGRFPGVCLAGSDRAQSRL